MNLLFEHMGRKKIILLLAVAVAIAALLVGVCVPLVQALAQPSTQQLLREKIATLGAKGWFLFLLLQMLQIIIAFIPGEIVQLMAGMLYGAWGGLLTCLLGSVLASALIFTVVRRVGDRLVMRLFRKNKLEEYAFLRDSERIETVVFLLFLIPGVPKDLLTYLAGISRIGLVKFLIVSTLARTPALAASTMIGASAGQGNLLLTGVLAVVVSLVALVGVIYRKRLMAFLHHEGRGA